ncbi:hypothetical protein EIP86_011299, partial [Pleurotus ostreatoroseus]
MAKIRADMTSKVEDLWEAYEQCLMGVNQLQETLDSLEKVQKQLLSKQNNLETREVRLYTFINDGTTLTHRPANHQHDLYADIDRIAQSVIDLREELEREATVSKRNHQSLMDRFSDLELTLNQEVDNYQKLTLYDEFKSVVCDISDTAIYVVMEDIVAKSHAKRVIG